MRRIIIVLLAILIANVCFSAPIIEVEPTELNFYAVEGESNPASQVLYISNDGTGKLEWEIVEDCAWLSVEPESGSCVDETDEVAVSVDITGLPRGEYSCELTISDPDAENSPQTVNIELEVVGPILEVAPLGFTYIASEGDNLVDQIITITNSGEGLLEWQITEDCDWLSVDLLSGSLLASEVVEVTVSIDITALSGSEYSCELTITDPDAENSPQIITVNLYIDEIILEVPSEYPTIQSAINTANDGDTVIVDIGTYVENINFGGKNITLTSTNPTDPNIVDATIIDGGGAGNVVTFAGSETSDCILTGFTITGAYGRGIKGRATHASIRNCVITGNNSYNGGGLISCNGLISNCIISCNSTEAYEGSGGGLSLCNGRIENCIITGNTADYRGGGLYACDGMIINCIVTKNIANSDSHDYTYGGGYHSCDGSIVNCIIVQNSARIGDQLYSCSAPTYSCIEGGYGNGEGNINNDPLFVDISSGDPSQWNLHLQASSPCIDTGTNVPEGGLPETDLDGNKRLTDGNYDGIINVDMGAYEVVQSKKAVVGISDEFIEFRAYEGQNDVPVQSILINNTGLSNLVWNAEISGEWLNCEPQSGVVPSEEQMEVIFSVDITDLVVGLYNCELVVSDPNAVNNPRVVEVLLGISPVDGNLWVPYQFDTIQEAIDAAADGDEIVLSDGTYTGEGNRDIDFSGKAITVRSQHGPENCIIDCEGSRLEGHLGFAFQNDEDPNAVLEGVTIINGWQGEGGGIYCSGSSPTIRNCVIRNNRASFGGGMYFWDSNAELSNCEIVENTAGSVGGGVYSCFGNLMLKNCILKRNSGGNGGGISVIYNSTCIIDTCLIAENKSFRNGGGIENVGNYINIINCTITDNTAEHYGGGVSAIRDSNIELVNCILWDNGAEYGGQMAAVEGSVPGSFDPGSIISVDYCNVEGGQAGVFFEDKCDIDWGDGVIDEEPGFVFEGDYHLGAGSACIDGGIDGYSSTVDDVDGNARVIDGDGNSEARIDIGAYEYNPDAPSIGLSRRIIDVSIPAGNLDIYEEVVSITNAGGGVLEWEVIEDCQWLSIEPESGICQQQASDFRVFIDPAGLIEGVNESLITVSSEGAVNSPQTIEVDVKYYRTLRVPDDYERIEEAMYAANDGDVVLVADGIHIKENNYFEGKAITVCSENGPGNCIIKCDMQAFRFMDGEDQNSIVSGFTIVNPSFYSMYGTIRCEDSSPTIKNCVFINNRNERGTVFCRRSNPIIMKCVFSNNESFSAPAAIYCESSHPVVKQCIFKNNRSKYSYYPELDGGAICCNSGGIKISDSTFESSYSSYGGAIYSLYGSVMVIDSEFKENRSINSGGGIYIYEGCLSAVGCSFVRNKSEYDYGGGAIGSRYSKARIEDCLFSGNTSEETGGALSLGSSMTYIKRCGFYGNISKGIAGAASVRWGSVDDCIFSGNRSADSGGGLFGRYSEVTNCSFIGNASSQGGGIYDAYSVSNCIFWDNRPDQIMSVEPVYCDIQGGYEGQGNIDVDPGFLESGHWYDNGTPTDETDDLWVNGDYRLRWNSPCIDAGDPNFAAEDGQTDLAGWERVVDGDDDGEAVVDMGAYEFENMPRLYVEPEVIIFNASGGVINPDEQLLAIQNAGSGVIDWSIVTDADWLLTDMSEGTSSGEIVFVTLDVDTAEMDNGLYRCKLLVNSSDAMDRPQTVEVVLAIGNSQWLFVPTEYITIQDAIDAAIGGDTIVVMDGTYTGMGNRDIDFLGKAVTVCSLNGPQNCIIDCKADNSGRYRGFVFTSGEDANSVLEGFTIKNGYAPLTQLGDYNMYVGGGVLCFQSSPTIENCVLNKNFAASNGGGMSCYDGSNPVISNCVFSKNVSDSIGITGSGLFCHECSPVIQNCRFTDNYYGAGMACFTSGALIESCVFTGNGECGLLCYNSSDSTILNCVFITNDINGAGISISWGDTTISNCITFMEGIEIESGEPTISYCNIDGGSEGVGNINELPFFVDYIRGDYHLMWDSPCVNSGNPAFVSEPDETDIDGEPRVMGGCIDMGIDEVGPKQADFTRDGIINTDDFSVLSNSWLTTPIDENWYILSDLWEDGLIDLGDLGAFIEDWLWEADWHE